jgi:hypothetical protein
MKRKKNKLIMWRCRKLKNNNFKNIQFFPPFSLSIDAHRHTKSEREKLASQPHKSIEAHHRETREERKSSRKKTGRLTGRCLSSDNNSVPLGQQIVVIVSCCCWLVVGEKPVFSKKNSLLLNAHAWTREDTDHTVGISREINLKPPRLFRRQVDIDLKRRHRS